MFATRASSPISARARVGFLHAHLVAEELQLVDDVGAGARVGRGAHGAAADRAGEHLDVGAGVGFGKEDALAGAAERISAAARRREGPTGASRQPIIHLALTIELALGGYVSGGRIRADFVAFHGQNGATLASSF